MGSMDTDWRPPVCVQPAAADVPIVCSRVQMTSHQDSDRTAPAHQHGRRAGGPASGDPGLTIILQTALCAGTEEVILPHVDVDVRKLACVGVGDVRIHSEVSGRQVTPRAVRVCDAVLYVTTAEPLPEGKHHITISLRHTPLLSTDILVMPPYPELVFNAGSHPPVAIAAAGHLIYTAYEHHVAQFSMSGMFLCDAISQLTCYINDLAVDEGQAVLALAVSEWERRGGRRFRAPAVQVFSLQGALLYVVDSRVSTLQFPVLRVAFSQQGALLVPDRDALCVLPPGGRDVQRRVAVEGLGVVSRLARMRSGHVTVLDGANSRLLVLDKVTFSVQHRRNLLHLRNQSAQSLGYSGLAVDSRDNVYISDCVRNVLRVFTCYLTEIHVVQSNAGLIAWPIALACSESDGLYLIDHFNSCVKRFKLSTNAETLTI